MNLEIIENKQICPGIFRMSIKHSGKLRLAKPGQFVHLRCSSSLDPLLRRPFSVYEMDAETIRILYNIAGKGTRILSQKIPGDYADIIGPLGNGFNTEPEPESAIIVAGGKGIAPTFFLASRLGGRVKRFLIGCKTQDMLLCDEEIAGLGIDAEKATDDGTCGLKGTVCSLLERVLSQITVSEVYACGPEEMLAEVAVICNNFNLPCQLSFESRMACGAGACLGCVIRVKDNGNLLYKRVCRDGPVFNGEQIAWKNRI